MAVSVLNAWVGEGDYPTNGLSLAASAGSNRVGILVLTGEINNDAGGRVAVSSVTWGGQTCVQQSTASAGTTGAYNDCVEIWTLNEDGVAAMSGSAITVTWLNFNGDGTFGTGGIGPFGNGKVMAAFYQDVDQANINSASNGNDTGQDTSTAIDLPMGVIDTDLDEQVIVGGVSGQGTTADDFDGETGWVTEQQLLGATNDHNGAIFTRDSQANDDALNVTFSVASVNRIALCSISLGAAAAGDFPIDALPAAFVITGIAEINEIGLPVDPDAFVLTGVLTGIENIDFGAVPASFVLTGIDTAHEVDFPAGAGIFTITGLAAILEFLIFNQEGFRWRNDDGTEITATWRQLQDIKDSVDKGDIVRARFLIDALGDQPSSAFQVDYKETLDPDIEYRKVEVE